MPLAIVLINAEVGSALTSVEYASAARVVTSRIVVAHLNSLRSPEEVYVPTSTLTEFDLVLRNRGYDETEVRETWAALAPLIGDKITAVTPSAHLSAAEMRSRGLSYFDSLIAALAKQIGAIVVTRDSQIARHVRTDW